MSNFDAILVPGGGVREEGRLPSWVERRFDRAIERFDGEYIIALSAGTTHRPPPIDTNGFPLLESTAAARYLIEAGIPKKSILTETCSYDTIGNAFFSRIIHVEPALLRRLLVITSDFHLPRSRLVFEWIYGLEPRPIDYILQFEGVADPSMDPAVLSERRRKEQTSVERLSAIMRQILTMERLHRWIFTEHDAYSAGMPGFTGSLAAQGLRSSY
ncbi:MAG TPA: YdcF family protein [Bryobacteraceae bacterium]